MYKNGSERCTLYASGVYILGRFATFIIKCIPYLDTKYLILGTILDHIINVNLTKFEIFIGNCNSKPSDEGKPKQYPIFDFKYKYCMVN